MAKITAFGGCLLLLQWRAKREEEGVSALHSGESGQQQPAQTHCHNSNSNSDSDSNKRDDDVAHFI